MWPKSKRIVRVNVRPLTKYKYIAYGSLVNCQIKPVGHNVWGIALYFIEPIDGEDDGMPFCACVPLLNFGK